jgi:hypothetical protein
MRTIGNDASGFSTSYDGVGGTVRVVSWGFWSAEIASALEGAVLGEYRTAPVGSRVLIDVSSLKPMRDEAHQAFVSTFGTLKALGAGKISVVTTSHLTKLQLMRVAAESGWTDRVQFI